MMFISRSIEQYAIAIDFTEYRLIGITPQSRQARATGRRDGVLWRQCIQQKQGKAELSQLSLDTARAMHRDK